MKITCKITQNQFEVSKKDLDFYNKIGVPVPSLCPEERMRRRMSYRNERNLYRRKCDATGKAIFSIYPNDSKFPVYENPYWWSDNFDAKEYAREFDFSKSFFENFYSLQKLVPLPSLSVSFATMENSDYCNQAGNLKNSYLLVNSDFAENCLYGKGVNRCFDCVDCFKIYDCEALYECLNCNNCKFSTFLFDSYNSSDCHFSSNLIGCQNCFGSINLRNKNYYFFNESFSKEDYQDKVKKYKLQYSLKQILSSFLTLRSKDFVKWMQENNTENCTGDYLVNCKNSQECFDSENLEDCKYCSDLKKGDSVSFNNYDISYFGLGITESYECISAGYGSNRVFFSKDIYGASEVYYSWNCVNNCRDLFGCIGLKKDQYCILNNQYTKDDYLSLKNKIIDHMKETGEWGEFFPTANSCFAYNDTVANEYFPLSKEQALQRGYQWRDTDPKEYQNYKYSIPESIEDVELDILDQVLSCEITGKNYKLQKAELNFYKKMKISIPRVCPDERHFQRMALRNPRRLYVRQCSRSNQEMITTYHPEQPEEVLSKNEYLKAIN